MPTLTALAGWAYVNNGVHGDPILKRRCKSGIHGH
jgi:hypothetical protein